MKTLKYKKIVLAGGTGQIGKALTEYFKDKCESIIVLSRSEKKIRENIRYVLWDGKNAESWSDELEGTDILINLTGKNVNCRYNEKNRKEIVDSRLNAIDALSKAIELCKTKPIVWIQSASATIYRHAEDHPMTEINGETGEGFSVEVCKKWESTFWKSTEKFSETRKIILRTSLVLGKKEGVFPRLKNLLKCGLGGKQGNGNQWVSWIHEEDLCRIVEWIYTHKEINGILNCTAPVPVKNTNLMKIMRDIYGMKFGLPAPKWMLEIGALLIGTETELILKSRWVLPERLNQSGFQFQYPDIESAIKDLKNT